MHRTSTRSEHLPATLLAQLLCDMLMQRDRKEKMGKLRRRAKIEREVAGTADVTALPTRKNLADGQSRWEPEIEWKNA